MNKTIKQAERYEAPEVKIEKLKTFRPILAGSNTVNDMEMGTTEDITW